MDIVAYPSENCKGDCENPWENIDRTSKARLQITGGLEPIMVGLPA